VFGDAADLAVDDPLELLLLLLPLRLEDVVFDEQTVLFFALELVQQGLPAGFDRREALLELIDARSHDAYALLALVARAVVAPEEVCGAELFELLERTAGFVQQIVLLTFPGQLFQLGIDDPELAGQAVQSL
jgi:hypothetical protein